MNEIRALRPDEIECRVQQIKPTGVRLLLYKDSRCDMNILDETFGVMGWKREHTRNNSNCIVSVWNNDIQQWISKEDTGTESNAEKEKGLASDSFKRACFNWGIGRELYTRIFIFLKVPVEKETDFQGKEIKDRYGKPKYKMSDPYATFNVSKIDVDKKANKIIHLEISDKYKKTVFVWDNKNLPIYDIEENTKKTEGVYKCSKCGAEIKGIKTRNGDIKTAKEVCEGLDGLCVKCYKEKQQEVKQENDTI